MDNRREKADSDEKRIYDKSTLLWEADHYKAYDCMEKLRASPDPTARVPAPLYNARLLRHSKASMITRAIVAAFRLRQRG